MVCLHLTNGCFAHTHINITAIHRLITVFIKDLRSWQAPGTVAQKWDTSLKLMTNGSSQNVCLVRRNGKGALGALWGCVVYPYILPGPSWRGPELDGLPTAEGRPSMAAGQQPGDRAVGLRLGSDPGGRPREQHGL